jgi:hypothetical protein
MTVKVPAPTIPVPNPLHKFASYSYALSLWWLDKGDLNNLANCTDVGDALSYTLSDKSYVLAEDSGLYPDRRVPASGGLNYILSDLVINTTIEPSAGTGQTNEISGKFVITEPYGCSLVNVIVAQSKASGAAENHLLQPYLLQVDFFGYDDAGNPIPREQTELYRKRWPIRLTNMKIDFNGGGSKYDCDFTPQAHEAFKAEAAKLPHAMTITAGTFGELLGEIEKQYNQHFMDQVKIKGVAQYADSIHFDIDPDIANSPVVNPDSLSLSQGNPAATDTDLKKAVFNFSFEEDIEKIIQKTFAQCDFWISEQLGLGGKAQSKQTQSNNATIVNTYKTVVQVLHQGISGSGSIVNNELDIQRCKYPYSYTFKIHQYATWGGTHPLDTSGLADSRPYVTKMYNYVYTGQNTDIIELKANFNMDYFTAVLAYGIEQAAAKVTPNTANDTQAQYAPQTGYALTPSFLINTVLPQLKDVKVLGPSRIQSLVQNMNVSSGMGGRVEAIGGMDVLKSKQFKSDMIHVKLNIVGDPTLLKQDDWLYSPSPKTSINYNNWDSMSQYDFAVKYGHMRMDTAQVIVGLQINTPIDIDTDYANTGLVFPEMQRNNNQAVSLFSGQYKIILIRSTFSQGKFTHILELARIMNQEYPNATEPGNDPTATSRDNQKQSVPTNSTSLIPGTSAPVSQTPGTTLLNTPVNPITIMPMTPTLVTNNTNGVGVQARQ